MEIKNLAEMLHPLERTVLPVLKENIELKEIIAKIKLQDVEVMRALQWLENKGIIKIKSDAKEIINLDSNGISYLKNKLPERRFLEALTKELSLNEIKEKAKLNDEELSISLGILKRKAAIEFVKDKIKIAENGKKLLNKEFLEEIFLKKLPLDLKELSNEDKYAYNELKKRKKIIKKDVVKLKFVSLTDLYAKISREKIETNVIGALTPGIIKSGEWKTKKFRRYDVKINVPKIYPGKRHFVNEAINYIKKIWLEMGFVEMEGPLLQTSFWDLDALFVPQDHPARSMQDTFFIKNPRYGNIPAELAKKVKATHENGWTTSSKGWQYKWDEKTAKENLLRTHTTVLSAQTIAKLKETDLPAKFFSVNKVFRNESLDWKHLFEFNQVEGIVIDPNANLKNLFGYLKEFYKKMGYKDVKLVPSHFPYTEPSMEIMVLHPTRNEWIELGGSGIFRPEVVKPLLGKAVPVLAWGQGMERIITEYYKITDLRDLYKNDLKQLKESKMWLK
ncbi:phenylalanine--tRNA ligase subunit alpha [Candidatus Woesearchaeota archaeon]|nr:phenylalanine--tRNA ligase subunit alpha [Candidatus Woesearchaeota archaeon]